ncbi:MAG: hypothetical protein ABSH24_08660 [Bryobacteraceae bacterium]|jgi:hypothetical protein
MGILVNNRELLSGACRVDVEFEDISSGAGQAAYCVSEFVSGFG